VSGVLPGSAISPFVADWLPRVAGVVHATIVGLVLGTTFAATGRIWMLMVAHAAFDLTALAMIDWSLETKVSRLIFK
jgi:membrane protease YdiL (CAAX protease family)